MAFDIEKIEQIFKERKPGVVGQYRYFSVLFPLVEQDGVLHVLFEVRAHDMKTQPGEVCFPGGMLEGEETPSQCALRETCEEIGICEDDIRLIARLDSVVNYSGFTIYSYLGVIDARALDRLKLNEGEVDEVFLVPLEWFVENAPKVHDVEIKPDTADFPYEDVGVDKDYPWRCGRMDVPVYTWNEHYIWGLTARMMRNFVRVITGDIR